MPTRLKILFITSWYPHRANPMQGIFVREHAKSVSLYDDVVVLHISGIIRTSRLWVLEKESDHQLSEGIPTYHFSSRKIPIPGLSYLLFLIGIWRIFSRLRIEIIQPDIIHANIYSSGIPSVLLGKLYHIPVVTTEQSSAFTRRLLTKGQLIRAKYSFQNSRKVIVVSRYLQKSIERYGIKANFHIIANTVDQKIFFPTTNPKSSRTRKRLLYVNNIVIGKGLEDLITALSKVSIHRIDWHLDVIGDGSQRSKCEQIVEILGLENQITFHGYLPKDKVAEFMREVDFFVLPSQSETFSAVAAEALSSGLPVLSTRCGGPEEYILPEVGRLVEVGKPEILAIEIEYMMEHIMEFSSEVIRKYAENRFSLEGIGLQHHILYNDLISETGQDST